MQAMQSTLARRAATGDAPVPRRLLKGVIHLVAAQEVAAQRAFCRLVRDGKLAQVQFALEKHPSLADALDEFASAGGGRSTSSGGGPGGGRGRRGSVEAVAEPAPAACGADARGALAAAASAGPLARCLFVLRAIGSPCPAGPFACEREATSNLAPRESMAPPCS